MKEAILAFFNKLLDYLKVRREKYKEIFEVKKFRKLSKAVDVAEDTYFLVDDIIDFLEELTKFNRQELRERCKKVEITYKERKDLIRFVKLYKKLRKIFFKLNQ